MIPQLTNNKIWATDLKCQKPDRKLDTRAVILIIVCGFFVLLMTIATLYDLIIRYISKQCIEGGNDNSKSEMESKYVRNRDSSTETRKRKGAEHISAMEEINNVISNVDLKPDTENCKLKAKTSSKRQYKPGIPGKLLLSFSVYTNSCKILSTHQGAGTLTAINGIRFISMTWVILGHTFAFGFLQGAVENVAMAFPMFISRLSFMAVLNAEVSVDTFFALSGTLLTYLVCKQLEKGKGRINWFMFYFHRIWRLTPPYMIIMGTYIALFPYIGEGPFWSNGGMEKNYCKDSWWYNLLYINNFRSVKKQCFAWSWYLANDMQFYIISPLIILPLFFSKLAGTIVVAVFLVGTTISAGVVSEHFNLGISTFGVNGDVYFDQYYQRPYCRMGPYLVGMYTGYILYKSNCKVKINKYVNLVLWAVFAVLACVELYGVYNNYNGNPMTPEVAALYNAVHKTVWGASVCWVIFSCATGNGGYINSFLSWKAFIPLGRLTYCAYLVHPIVQFYYYGSRKKMTYWDDLEVIYQFIGHLVLAYAVAFVASMSFESPMMGIEKVVFKSGEKKKEEESTRL